MSNLVFSAYIATAGAFVRLLPTVIFPVFVTIFLSVSDCPLLYKPTEPSPNVILVTVVIFKVL